MGNYVTSYNISYFIIIVTSVKSLKDFAIAKSNFIYYLKSGKGSLVDIYEDEILQNELDTKKIDVNLYEYFGANIIANAILKTTRPLHNHKYNYPTYKS